MTYMVLTRDMKRRFIRLDSAMISEKNRELIRAFVKNSISKHAQMI